MTKKPGLSLEQHKAIGPELQNIQEVFTELRCIFGSAYPVKGNKALAIVTRLEADMRDLRDLLENKCIAEHRLEFPSGLEVYSSRVYPEPQPSDAVLALRSIRENIQLRKEAGK